LLEKKNCMHKLNVLLLFVAILLTNAQQDYDEEDYIEYDEDLTYDGDEPPPMYKTDNSTAAPEKIILSATYILISAIGIIANFIVFFVIIAGREISKTVTAMYVLQLTITDSLFLSMLPLFAIHKLTDDWTFGVGFCKAARFIQTQNYTASILFLTAMSVDRYIAVAYNTRSQQLRTKKRTLIVCLLIWIFSGLMSLPQVLFGKIEHRGVGRSLCKIVFPGSLTRDQVLNDLPSIYYYYPEDMEGDSSGHYVSTTSGVENSTFDYDQLEGVSCRDPSLGLPETIWSLVKIIITFVIPFVIITVSYVFIVRKLQISESKLASSVGSRCTRVRKRVTKMVAILVLCFAICWFPHYIMVLVKLKGSFLSFTTCDYLVQAFTAMAYSNSAINPILYTFLGHNFKDRLKESIRNAKKAMLPEGFLKDKIFESAMSKNGWKNTSASERNRKSQFLDSNGTYDHRGVKLQDMNKKHDSNNSKKDSIKSLSLSKCKNRQTEIPLCETEMTPVERSSANGADDDQTNHFFINKQEL